MFSTGYVAERNLANFIAEPLLYDFIFLNPEYEEGKKTRELSDLLIEDDRLGIPIQLKFQDREKASIDRDEQKWAIKNILRASKQLTGTIRNIEKYEITSEHPYRGKVIFPEHHFQCKCGIVIVDYQSKPFIIDSSLLRRAKNNIPIHYFSYNDFITLCQKLMSLPDLMDYLEQRANIPAWATPKFGDEKNAYAYYLTNKGKFSSSIIISDFDNKWDELTTKYKDAFQEKEKEDENVYIFNEILKTFSTKEPIELPNRPSYVQSVTKINDPNRINVTRIINRIRRIHRREISKKLLEKIIKAEKSELGFNYFAYKTDDPETIFLFLSSRNSRTKRVEELTIMIDCVNNILNPKRVIGIATESENALKGRSFDIMCLEDVPPSDRNEDIENCKQFFGEFNMGFEYDFPADKRRKFSI